ncbi:alpha-glucosidase-like [Planococcus citri]|uniref:alpha-glucosidase-like n=1 Tax=Planococcus citri TaxID=170843 RepID=UPI0031F916DF
MAAISDGKLLLQGYVYVKSKKSPDGTKTYSDCRRVSIFSHKPGSGWTWNAKRRQFYFHQFLVEQPDFDLSNENLKKELWKMMEFWLNKGVAGFRLDATPFFFEDKEFRDDNIFLRQFNQPETIEFIHEFRTYLDKYNKEHGGFESFPVEAMTLKLYIIFWSFLKDEGKISAWMTQDHDGPRVGSRISPEYADIFTILSMMLPGTVGVYYGQEIAMMNGFATEDQFKDFSGRGTRDPNRLLMQWDNSLNAGFSTNLTTYSPVNSDYFQRNVAAQKTQSQGKVLTVVVNFETTTSSRLNLTEILQNRPNEITVVAASVNSEYLKRFNIEFERSEEFYMRPLSSVVLETDQPYTENEDVML